MKTLWIRVEANVGDNDKVWSLGNFLGISAATALGHLVMLWGAVAQHRTDGDLSGVPDALIERWAGWSGTPGQFASAFREQFVSDDVVAGWADRQGKLAERAEKDRARKAGGPSTETPRKLHGNSAPTLRNGTVRSNSKDQGIPAAAAATPGGGPDLFPAAEIPEPTSTSQPAVPASGGKGGKGRGKATETEPKYPHYPPEACNALYAVWESRVGSFKYSRFRAETAPLFDRPGGRYGADVLDGALKIAVEVLKHRAEDQGRPFDWERFTPAVWVGRIAYWVQCWEKAQADPMFYATLMPTRGGRIAA